MLVSGRNARVGSRGDERQGLTPEEAEATERQFRAANPDKKEVPDRAYRTVRKRPLLLLHVIKPRVDGVELSLGVEEPVVALGLSFPPFDDEDVAKRVAYQVNKVEYRSLFEAEADDEIETSDADPD